MELQIGDRLTDETGEWEVVSRPYTTNAGKDAHARVQKVGQPDVTETRTWGAHERISVTRARSRRGGQAMMTVWLLLIMYTANGQQSAYANVYASAAACERTAKEEIAVHRALDPTYQVTSTPPYCREVPVRER